MLRSYQHPDSQLFRFYTRIQKYSFGSEHPERYIRALFRPQRSSVETSPLSDWPCGTFHRQYKPPTVRWSFKAAQIICAATTSLQISNLRSQLLDYKYEERVFMIRSLIIQISALLLFSTRTLVMKFLATVSIVALLTSSTLARPGSNLSQRVASRRANDRKSQPKIKSESSIVETNSTFHEEYSENWAGVFFESPPSGETYSTVTGTFTVPSISGNGAASAWVGIDGVTYTDAILQAGLNFTISDGTISYDAWYEWYVVFKLIFVWIRFGSSRYQVSRRSFRYFRLWHIWGRLDHRYRRCYQWHWGNYYPRKHFHRPICYSDRQCTRFVCKSSFGLQRSIILSINCTFPPSVHTRGTERRVDRRRLRGEWFACQSVRLWNDYIHRCICIGWQFDSRPYWRWHCGH